MRFLFTCPLLIVSTAFFHVSPVLAADRIEDARPDSVAEWVRQVNLKLYRSMAVGEDVQGLVVVTFRRGADGRPAAVQVHDAPLSLDQAARETLRRAHRLPPLPFGVNPDQPIRVRLLFAGDENRAVYVAKRRALFASADAANHMFDAKPASTGASLASSQ
jgi:TonB family protein